MKADALNDLRGKSETKDHDQIVGQELGGGPWLALVSLSEDGKSICMIDNTGRWHCADIPIPEPVDTGGHPAVRRLMPSSSNTCPNCGCIKIVIAGMIMYYDPIKKQLCGHNCSFH